MNLFFSSRIRKQSLRFSREKFVLLPWNDWSWLPHLFGLFQKLHKTIKHSKCLALRLPGDSQLRLTIQKSPLYLETFRPLLYCRNVRVWVRNRLQCSTQTSGLGLGNQGFKQTAMDLTETSMPFRSQNVFTKTFWCFRSSLLLRVGKSLGKYTFPICLWEKGWIACTAFLPSVCQSWNPLRAWIGSSLFIYYHLLKNTFNNNKLFAVSLI